MLRNYPDFAAEKNYSSELEHDIDLYIQKHKSAILKSLREEGRDSTWSRLSKIFLDEWRGEYSDREILNALSYYWDRLKLQATSTNSGRY